VRQWLEVQYVNAELSNSRHIQRTSLVNSFTLQVTTFKLLQCVCAQFLKEVYWKL